MAPSKTYDISITFKSAENLPVADIGTLSSDPYVAATLHTPESDRDKVQSPPLRFRTPTVRTTTNPTWERRWDISNVSRSGTRLRVEVLDEDYRDNDDKLGHVVIDFATLSIWGEGVGTDEKWYKLKKKGASKKAAVLRLCVAGAKKNEGRTARVLVKIEVKGEAQIKENQDIGRAFTSGPNYWSKHFSPIIGKFVGAKDSDSSKADVFSFEANKLQLTGPAPPDLHHDFVGFAPFVTAYFTRSGLRGRVLNRALHSQYNHLYCYDERTDYGCIDNTTESKDSNALAKQFLEMVHWSEGYRLFTYVITLDSEWHFTETGDEFAIDLLSKHSLHSDVSRVIAYSGEFFVRRKHHHEHPHHEAAEAHMEKDGDGASEGHRDVITPENSPKHPHNHSPDHDPAHYELVIDNDSGTYRPDKKLLPKLQEFLESNLQGIGGVVTYDCFDKELKDLKHNRKEAKQHAGCRIFRQRSISSSGSSISSSDEEELDTGREGNVFKRLRSRWMMGDAGGGR